MLARVRLPRPTITALLMDQETFEQHADGNAVCESISAGGDPSSELSKDEQEFYRYLLALERGRLEQEYIPHAHVHEVLFVAHRSPLTAHRSPLTAHRSPLTAHRSPLTAHHSPHSTKSASIVLIFVG